MNKKIAEIRAVEKTFRDHYEMWLIENNKTKEEWSYERWINEWCFKDLRGKL